jgi:diguanylate cyclase (GGDEF)-like protein
MMPQVQVMNRASPAGATDTGEHASRPVSRLAQEVADTYERSRSRGAFYLAGWLLIGAYGHALAAPSGASYALTFAFIALALARFRLRPPLADEPERQRRWLHWQVGIVFTTAALWGVLQTWVLVDPALADARTVSLVCSIAYATAIAHTYCMRLGPALGAIGVLYLPAVVVSWSQPGQRAVAIALTIYLVYLLMALSRSHREYQGRLDLDQALREQRDSFRRLSVTDGLTGLANRRAFGEALRIALDTSRDDMSPLSIAILDLDHFKAVNDRHGHAVGDACLVAFAQRLRAAFDTAAELPVRLGGEEFAVLLPDTDEASAAVKADAFRATLEREPLRAGAIEIAITVSAGVGQFDPSRHADADDLYRAVDRALYRAKEEGRNRVCRGSVSE